MSLELRKVGKDNYQPLHWFLSISLDGWHNGRRGGGGGQMKTTGFNVKSTADKENRSRLMQVNTDYYLPAHWFLSLNFILISFLLITIFLAMLFTYLCLIILNYVTISCLFILYIPTARENYKIRRQLNSNSPSDLSLLIIFYIL